MSGHDCSQSHGATQPPATNKPDLNAYPTGSPAEQIMLLSFRFSGGLSSREHLPGKGSNSPAHAHQRYWPTIIGAFNMHHKCTGVCRFVRGDSCGDWPPCHRLVWFLWGLQEALDLPDQPTRAPGYSDLWVLAITLRITQGYQAAYQPEGDFGSRAETDAWRRPDGQLARPGRACGARLPGWWRK